MNTTLIVVVTDSSFVNSKGLWSLLGLVTFIFDVEVNTNLVHCGSQRFRRVTRSVIVSYLHSLILEFYFAYTVSNILEEIQRRTIRLGAYSDRKPIFYFIAKDGNTT